MTLLPVAAYCRCSTDKQELSIPAQKTAILEYAEESGYHVVDWYEDQGKSGTTAAGRPAFRRLLDRVTREGHGYSAILVYDIDRWGRFIDPEEATYFRVLCKQHGAPVRFVVDGQLVNRGDIGSQVTMTVKQVVATEESRKRSEIVYERSAQNAQRGYSSGGYPPYGYSRMLYESNGTPIGLLPWGRRKSEKSQKVGWVPDPATAPVVCRIFHMYAHERKGVKAIVASLNNDGICAPRGGKWCVPSVVAILDNPSYVGARSYGKSIRGAFQRSKAVGRRRAEWIEQPAAHEPIISREVFESTRARRREMSALAKDKARVSSLRNGTFLLSPYLVCNECGLRFHGVSQTGGSGRIYHRYVDGAYEARGPSACSRFAIPRDSFEGAVLSIVADLVTPAISRDRIVLAIQEEIAQRNQSANVAAVTQRRQLADVDLRLGRIKAAILEGFSPDDFRTEYNNLQRQRQTLILELERLEAKAPDKHRLAAIADDVLNLMGDIRTALSHSDRKELKSLIGRVIERIEIDKVRLKALVYVRPLPVAAAGGLDYGGMCETGGIPTSGIFVGSSALPSRDALSSPQSRGLTKQETRSII